MGPRGMADTSNSVLESIRAQNYQSVRRLEQVADESRLWFAEVFETYRRQIADGKFKHAQGHEKSPVKKKAKVETCLSPETVDFVYSLRVKELKAMLSDRGLEETGVKKLLQSRLIEALETEKAAEKCSTSNEEKEATADEQLDIGIEQRADMEIDPLAPSDPRSSSNKVEAGPDPMEIEKQSSEPMELEKQSLEKVEETTTLQAQGEEPSANNIDSSPRTRTRSPLKMVKSAFKALSPNKQQKTVTSIIQKLESNNQAREEHTVATASSRGDESHSKLDSTLPKASASASKIHRIWGGTTTSVSKTNDPSGSSTKVPSMKSLKAARQAKIAEIRSKSKPVATSTTAISTVPTLSKVKTYAECAQFSSVDGKKNLLAAQMREKANSKFQQSQQSLQSSTGSDQLKENSPNKAAKAATGLSTSSGLTSSSKTLGESPKHVLGESNKLMNGFSYASKTFGETLKSAPGFPVSLKTVGESGKFILSAKKEQTPSSAKSNFSSTLSPMDTYELSDRDQSDSESESEGKGKSKKRIPEWAQKAKLIPALEQQFNQKEHDPDQIFGEVLTCDLQEIFDTKKARYQRRTSSGNWTQDRVTAAEKLAYKRNEGFADQDD
ncbi:hypothetical protein ACA910_013347 [Epithemia clementina (nom. ined.)]